MATYLLGAKHGGWKSSKIRLKCQITLEFLPEETQENPFELPDKSED